MGEDQMASRSLRDDILAQPSNLDRVASDFLPRLAGVDHLRQFRREPLVFTGMGASFCAVVPSAEWLRTVGHSALSIKPTELSAPGARRLMGACVALSESGRSAETVEALRALSVPRLALTLDGRGPLAEVADLALPIGSAQDRGISVLTYTGSLLACAAVSALLGPAPMSLDMGRIVGSAEEVCHRSAEVADRLAERMSSVRAIDAVGGPFAVASATYAALFIREAARIPAAGFDTRAYLHGPVEVAERGIGAVVFGDGREIDLARSLASAGVLVLLVTAAEVRNEDSMEVVRVPEAPPVLQPILHAIPAQLLGEALARERGLAPGSFRHEQPDTRVGPP